ncbi:MAG: ribosome maturation factor RimP [Eubacterium sp.]|nr:ribosome maturation factor RimP [Eubacterium sp.]
MAKKKIKDVVAEILETYLDERGLELWNVEFVKEVKDWFLRVYIDKKSHVEGEYISISECEEVSRYLSEILDQDDPIEQNYYLEVSSPGMDRELITPAHYERYVGSLVDMKLYKAVDGRKNITAVLSKIDEENYYLVDENDNELVVEKSQVAKTRLAVVF